MSDAVGTQVGDNLRGGLRDGVKERVAATDVGCERMPHADAIAEFHDVRITRPTAVGLVRAGGKDRTKYAVFHMKHWHMLVNHDFQTIQVFAEFVGPNSFAGLHKASDPKELRLFDVKAEPFGIIGPWQFVADFGRLPIARVVYEGKRANKARSQAAPAEPGFRAFRAECKSCKSVFERKD